MSKLTLLVIFSGVILNATAQILLKAGTDRLGDLFSSPSAIPLEVLRISSQPFILSGLFCYVVSVALWIYALSKSPVSVAYPMISIGYIANAVAAHYIFGESLTPQKIIGILIIVIGVFILVKS